MRLTTLLTLIGLLAILALILLPVTACGCKQASKATACLSHLKQQSLGLLQYGEDADERFPARDLWMDGVSPYVKDEAIFHDVEAPKGAYGYAFNAGLSEAREPREPEKVPMIYDSRNPVRNASDAVASLPRPGRHNGKNGIAYADGHVKRVAP